MKDIIFKFKVIAGKFSLGSPDNKKRWDYMLQKLDGKVAYMEISERKPKRSTLQNNLYWLWIEIISNHLGYTKNEAHELFKKLLIPPKMVKYRGRMIEIIRSTTDLNKSEMAEYLIDLEKEAGTLGIILPSPEEYLK